MIKCRKQYIMLSSDYSQQEVKIMAQVCQDEKMLQAFRDNLDFYSQVASLSFEREYRDCLEFEVDDNLNFIFDEHGNKITNKEGKKYRNQAKAILLGILYGRGEASIAEQIGCTSEQAIEIKANIFRSFPSIKKFEEDTINMAKTKGYVLTLWGRKRRLPEMQLPDYEFSYADGRTMNRSEQERRANILKEIKWYKAKEKKIEQWSSDGIIVKSNIFKKRNATRQCVNAVIQGSAADMAKKALIAVHKDERIRLLGGRLLNQIHDELLLECPKENGKEVAELFSNIMSNSATDKLHLDITCDVTASYCWYGEEIEL